MIVSLWVRRRRGLDQLDREPNITDSSIASGSPKKICVVNPMQKRETSIVTSREIWAQERTNRPRLWNHIPQTKKRPHGPFSSAALAGLLWWSFLARSSASQKCTECTVSCSNAIFVLPKLLNTSVNAVTLLDIADEGTRAGPNRYQLKTHCFKPWLLTAMYHTSHFVHGPEELHVHMWFKATLHWR